MKKNNYVVKVKFANGQVSLQKCNKRWHGIRQAVARVNSWPIKVSYRKL